MRNLHSALTVDVRIIICYHHRDHYLELLVTEARFETFLFYLLSDIRHKRVSLCFMMYGKLKRFDFP